MQSVHTDMHSAVQITAQYAVSSTKYSTARYGVQSGEVIYASCRFALKSSIPTRRTRTHLRECSTISTEKKIYTTVTAKKQNHTPKRNQKSPILPHTKNSNQGQTQTCSSPGETVTMTAVPSPRQHSSYRSKRHTTSLR